jgi:glycosyltransferase involved in cell wall biosynthesis
VGVLICTYQRAGQLREALAGLRRQTLAPDEVLVVARPDDAPSRAVVAETTGLLLREVLVERPGVVAARNAGLEVSTAEVLAFLDDDAVPDPDWLERMAAHYDVPDVGAVGGRDRVFHDGVPVEEGVRRDVGTLTWYGRFVALHHRGAGAARDVDHLKGVNMSFRRGRFPDIRVDELLRGHGAQVHEEASVTLEVKRRGYRVVYDPAITVDHFEADRGQLDARAPVQARPRRDRHHNQTYVVTRYYPPYRAVVHFLFAVLVGTSDAPGLVTTLRDVARSRRLRLRHLELFWTNLRGRVEGVGTALRRSGHDRHRAAGA